MLKASANNRLTKKMCTSVDLVEGGFHEELQLFSPLAEVRSREWTFHMLPRDGYYRIMELAHNLIGGENIQLEHFGAFGLVHSGQVGVSRQF